MAKQVPNVSYDELVELGGPAVYPEVMYSIITGNGVNPVTVHAGNSQGQIVEPGGSSALQACLRFAGGVPTEDFVNVAHFDDNGALVPGKDIGTDHILVIWLHFPNDGDKSAASWN